MSRPKPKALMPPLMPQRRLESEGPELPPPSLLLQQRPPRVSRVMEERWHLKRPRVERTQLERLVVGVVKSVCQSSGSVWRARVELVQWCCRQMLVLQVAQKEEAEGEGARAKARPWAAGCQPSKWRG